MFSRSCLDDQLVARTPRRRACPIVWSESLTLDISDHIGDGLVDDNTSPWWSVLTLRLYRSTTPSHAGSKSTIGCIGVTHVDAHRFATGIGSCSSSSTWEDKVGLVVPGKSRSQVAQVRLKVTMETLLVKSLDHYHDITKVCICSHLL